MRTIEDDIADALGTGERGENLVSVAREAHRAELASASAILILESWLYEQRGTAEGAMERALHALRDRRVVPPRIGRISLYANAWLCLVSSPRFQGMTVARAIEELQRNGCAT